MTDSVLDPVVEEKPVRIDEKDFNYSEHENSLSNRLKQGWIVL